MKLWLAGGRVVDPHTGEDAVRDVFVADGEIVANGGDGFVRLECGGLVVAPGFTDLHANLQDVGAAARAGVAGGFTTIVLAPGHPAPIERPSVARDLLVRAGSAPCRVEIAGALTVGLRGEDVADVGLLLEAGCAALSNGTTPIRNARVLRHVLEYAGRFKRPILLRAADPELEAGGIVREGPRAMWLGLPYVPPEAEEIGVSVVAALVRRTGVPVHLTHLWSRRGVDALRRARSEGLPVSGSTTTHHLALDDGIIDESAYAGGCRFVPPLGDASDRQALAQALRDGVLAGVATDHRPVAPHEQDRELELAVPGAVGLETALPLVLEALDHDVVAAVRALATGPAAVLGAVATLRVGAPADLVVFDPDGEWTVGRDTLRSPWANTPLLGRQVRGVAKLVVARGRVVHELQA